MNVFQRLAGNTSPPLEASAWSQLNQSTTDQAFSQSHIKQAEQAKPIGIKARELHTSDK
jgi:hypothetical protein